MDKEKEIEDFGYCIRDAHVHIAGTNSELPMKVYQGIAKELLKKAYGYRKADEVRKETAKEIYERVDKWLDEIVPHTREETILICLLGWINTKYGVEDDE